MTDLDDPEPELKYLSGFAIQKGQPKSSIKGPLHDLLAPRRGPTTASPPSLPPVEPTTQHLQPTTLADDDDGANAADPPLPASQPVPTTPVPEQTPLPSSSR